MGQSLCVEAWGAMTAAPLTDDNVESIDFEGGDEKNQSLIPAAKEEATESDGYSSRTTPTCVKEISEEVTNENDKAKQEEQETAQKATLQTKSEEIEIAETAISIKTSAETPHDENTKIAETVTTTITATTSERKQTHSPLENMKETHKRDTPSFAVEEQRNARTVEKALTQEEFLVPLADTPAKSTVPVVHTTNSLSPAESNRTPSPSLRREKSVTTGAPSAENNPCYRLSSPFAPARHESGHNRSRSDGILSMDDATRLHASWSNADPEDFSAFCLASFGHLSSAYLDEPRRSSVSLSRVSSVDAAVIAESSVSSIIHDAARITNWETVKELCVADPEAASYVGRDRWTALHHACNRRCPFPNVVEALISAYPDALLQEEDKGWLPLHYACRFKAPKDVVRLLIHMYPDKGKTAVNRLDRQGRTPLYYAVRYDAPPGVVGLLLEVDATAVLEEDQNADSPLALVWDAWAEKMDGKRTLQRIYIQSEEAATMPLEEQSSKVYKRLRSQKKLHERWNKVNIFLKAAFGFSVDDDNDVEASTRSESKNSAEGNTGACDSRSWRILHATAAIKCHPSLFMLAKASHPEQCFEIDNRDLKGPIHISGDETAAHGLTALHLAASSHASGEASKLVINELLMLNPSAAEAVDSSNSLPLHRIVENKFKSHWSMDGAKEIYLSNTAAISVADIDGKLPLHRAAATISHSESSETVTKARSAICNLLELNPEAASHADNFGCFPLHLVAQNGSKWDYQINYLYDANPSAAQSRTGVKLLNRLPLHMAASNPSSTISMIDTLVKMNPRGATQADRKGNYPLHLACAAALSWESINAIYKAFPDAAQQAEGNDRGWTALQIAASSAEGHVDVIANLCAIYPQAAGVTDSDGRYAFHLACFAGRKWEEGLSSIFQSYPNAVRTPDRLGLLPLHIVSFRYSASSEQRDLDCPDPMHQNSRRFSKAASFDIEQAAMKEREDAKRIENLFHLLRADPTVLSAYQ